MSSVLLIIQSLLILITTHLACRVVQRVLRKSPLDNLPGPAPAPWLMGECASVDPYSRLLMLKLPQVTYHSGLTVTDLNSKDKSLKTTDLSSKCRA